MQNLESNYEKTIQKVDFLTSNNRFEEAQKELINLLGIFPNDANIKILLAETFINTDNFSKAEGICKDALTLSPNNSKIYYLLARIKIGLNKKNDAENFIRKAIEINPIDTDYFALLSFIKINKKEFEDALKYAEKGLEFDSENIFALNMRSKALIKLGKTDNAYNTIETALENDPENEFTHTNLAWSLLETKQYKKSLVHFKEALKIDPNFEYAKAGMLEVLKAKNIFYRQFLKYAFWISNFSSKKQIGIIIGIYIGFQVFNRIAAKIKFLEPLIIPFIIIVSLIFLSTWLIVPISNSFIRISTYGKYLLDKKARISSTLFLGTFSVAIIATVLYFITQNLFFAGLVVFSVTLSIPLTSILTPNSKKGQLILGIYSIFMFVLGSFALYNIFISNSFEHESISYYTISFVVFQFLANFMIAKED